MDVDAVAAMVRLISLKDLTTAAHTWRVVLYTRAMAEEFGLPPAEVERLGIAAALHDIGKLDIPDEILQKPGKLTDDEFRTMQLHTVRGHERLLLSGETNPVTLELVRHHHERWDGLGYPDRLKGEAITRAPRIFAVIDSFDAMTSLRPYRQDVGPEAAERALAELHAGSGTRYWPQAVELFDRLYRSGHVDWILEYYNDRAEHPQFCARAVSTLRRGG